MMRNTKVFDCSLLHLSKIQTEAGCITSVTNGENLPFDVKRVYYLYDIPGGETRGGHAHKELHQLIVAASGSFEILLDDGTNKKVVSLNRPYHGLLILPGIWREIFGFSSGAICLVLASAPYTESDYIRNFELFLDYKGAKNKI